MSQNIQSSFETTLKDSSLENLAIDLSELTIDNLTNEGILKEVPIIGTLVNLARFGANIKDRLFLKKIVYFLDKLKDIPIDQRKKMIEEIDGSEKFRLKVGEKLLYIIDSCNDYENSEIAAVLFKAFIEGKITYDAFLESSNIIMKITSQDFQWFLKNGQKYMYVEDIGGLLSSGLFDLNYEPIDIRVEEETDHKVLLEGGNKYKTDVDGGNMRVSTSRAGEIILEVFSPTYKKPKVLKI